jgi:hypothetical protein
MANTYTLIASSTVGSGGAADIEFTSIPSTYTDLAIQISPRSAKTGGSAWDSIYLRFNGSTTNYDDRGLAGTGSSVVSFTDTGTPNRIFLGDVNMGDNTASTFGSVSVYIPNYAGSNNKSVSSDSVQENNATAALAELNAGIWSDSAAITSIKLFFISDNLVQYSTAYLYGISNS